MQSITEQTIKLKSGAWSLRSRSLLFARPITHFISSLQNFPTILKQEKLFFELIRVAIGNAVCLSHTPTAAEWNELYAMAKKQSLVGICFAGVQRLQMQQQCPPEVLYLQWMGMAAKIQQRNEVIDNKTAKVWRLLCEAGLEAAILKGQGIATLYDLPLQTLRHSGDIDVWVKGGFTTVNRFVQETKPTTDIAYHRFHYDIFQDTEVELHHRPTLMRNLFDSRKLLKWCDSFGSDTFVRVNKGFDIPSLEFNRIFILTHIYRHFLFEGIGLRQIMDFYYVLKQSQSSRAESKLLEDLRLQRFTGALMWVLSVVFDMDKKYFLSEPNEKEGRFLLNEIMETGNFGKGETRFAGQGKLRRMINKRLILITHYPSEVLWTPIWLIYHRLWKTYHKYIINHESTYTC